MDPPRRPPFLHHTTAKLPVGGKQPTHGGSRKLAATKLNRPIRAGVELRRWGRLDSYLDEVRARPREADHGSRETPLTLEGANPAPGHYMQIVRHLNSSAAVAQEIVYHGVFLPELERDE